MTGHKMHFWSEYAPPRNGPCLCGSGLTFKRCCADRLPGSAELGKAARKAFSETNYRSALLSVRADVTQYTIWHKRHTERALLTDAGFQKLLNIDIKALNELVGELVFCYQKLDLQDDLAATIERLRGNIKDPRWDRKISYYQVLNALGPRWNRAEGRKEFKKLGKIEDETDVEIIQLYIDLFGGDLSFSQLCELYDKIINLSESEPERLHYRSAKALQFLLVGDEDRAARELAAAISIYRSNKSEKQSLYASRYFGESLSLLARIKDDPKLFDEALEEFQSLLKRTDITDHGRADLLRSIAENYKLRMAWDKALDAYRQSTQLEDSAICKTFIAECLLHQNKKSEAAKAIKEIKVEDFSDASEIEDYTFILAEIAAECADKKLLEQALNLLKILKISAPLFEQRRTALLLAIIETQQRGANQSALSKIRRAVAGRINSVNTYLMLRPNFMGVGVDLGKIIEDLTKAPKDD